jgi:hypothetical protein
LEEIASILEVSDYAKKKLALPVMAYAAQKYQAKAQSFCNDYYGLCFRKKP